MGSICLDSEQVEDNLQNDRLGGALAIPAKVNIAFVLTGASAFIPHAVIPSRENLSEVPPNRLLLASNVLSFAAKTNRSVPSPLCVCRLHRSSIHSLRFGHRNPTLDEERKNPRLISPMSVLLSGPWQNLRALPRVTTESFHDPQPG